MSKLVQGGRLGRKSEESNVGNINAKRRIWV